MRCTAQLNEAFDKLKAVEAELSAKGESEAKLRLERDESTKQLSELRQQYDVMRSNFKDRVRGIWFKICFCCYDSIQMWTHFHFCFSHLLHSLVKILIPVSCSEHMTLGIFGLYPIGSFSVLHLSGLCLYYGPSIGNGKNSMCGESDMGVKSS